MSEWINDRGSCPCLAAKTPHSQPALTSSSTLSQDSSPAITVVSLQRVLEIFILFQDSTQEKCESNTQTSKSSVGTNGVGVEDNYDGVDDDVPEEKPYPLPLLPPWAAPVGLAGPPEAVIILNDRPRQKTLH